MFSGGAKISTISYLVDNTAYPSLIGSCQSQLIPPLQSAIKNHGSSNPVTKFRQETNS